MTLRYTSTVRYSWLLFVWLLVNGSLVLYTALNLADQIDLSFLLTVDQLPFVALTLHTSVMLIVWLFLRLALLIPSWTMRSISVLDNRNNNNSCAPTTVYYIVQTLCSIAWLCSTVGILAQFYECDANLTCITMHILMTCWTVGHALVLVSLLVLGLCGCFSSSSAKGQQAQQQQIQFEIPKLVLEGDGQEQRSERRQKIESITAKYSISSSSTPTSKSKSTTNTCNLCTHIEGNDALIDSSNEQQLRCGHKYHKICIQRYFKQTKSDTCPTCLTNLVREDPV